VSHLSLWVNSEEIFDFSAEQMTTQKAKNLKNQMCGEFSEIFQLCHEILEKAQKPSLIKATLETLLRFLNWIPLGYIFETNLIDILNNRVCFFGLFNEKYLILQKSHFQHKTPNSSSEFQSLEM
jgi:exportin-1